MMRTMCRAKLHRLTVTEANLHYIGSITLDSLLMDAADILPYEQVQVVNINTGARLETYALPGAKGSGVVCLNGAAARLAHEGDLVIVMNYAICTDDEARTIEPRVVFVDSKNGISKVQVGIAAGQSDE